MLNRCLWVALVAACAAQDYTHLVETYITYGAGGRIAPPNCTAWMQIWDPRQPNTTTRTPIGSGPTGCTDATSPKDVCKYMAGCFSSVSSKLIGDIMVETYSASVSRIAFTWLLAGITARNGHMVNASGITILPIQNTPDFGPVISGGSWFGNPADMFSRCLGGYGDPSHCFGQ